MNAFSWLFSEVGVGAICAVSLVACALLRRRSAGLRHLVLGAGLLLAATFPLGRLGLPEISVPILPEETPALRAAPIVTAPDSQMELRRAEPLAPSGRIEMLLLSPRQPVALWIWLAGFLGVLAHVALGHRAARKTMLASKRAGEASPWAESWESSQQAISRAVALRISKGARVPFTYGLLRPSIVLPPADRSWTPSSRRCALLHEGARIRRADWATQQLFWLACAAHWWNPLVWLCLAELHRLAEAASDDLAVRSGADPMELATELLKAARHTTAQSPVEIAAAPTLVGRPGLTRRIRRLVDPTARRSLTSAAAVITVVSLSLLAGTTLGTLRATTKTSSLSPGAERLIEAAEDGDLEEVNRLLARDIDIDAHLPGSGTALVAAARQGNDDVVLALLERGADPNIAADGDGTALLVASESGDLALMSILFDWGARVDVATPGDGTALIAAARAGQMGATSRLIEEGADLDFVVLGDETALIQASAHGRLEIVRLLLEAGADPELSVTMNALGRPFANGPRSPLSEARKAGYEGVVRLLESWGARQ